MSDLSLPPLSLLPPETEVDGRAVAEIASADAWPSPPLDLYAPLPVTDEAQPCEVEGLNGRIMRVNLVRFDGDAGVVEVLSPGLRAPMPLRFGQFRRLTLNALIKPAVTVPTEKILSYQISTKSGTDRTGLTVGHVSAANGIFLFEPQDSEGGVRRVFVPATAFEELHIDGARVEMTPAPAPEASPGPAASAQATAEAALPTLSVPVDPPVTLTLDFKLDDLPGPSLKASAEPSLVGKAGAATLPSGPRAPAAEFKLVLDDELLPPLPALAQEPDTEYPDLVKLAEPAAVASPAPNAARKAAGPVASPSSPATPTAPAATRPVPAAGTSAAAAQPSAAPTPTAAAPVAASTPGSTQAKPQTAAARRSAAAQAEPAAGPPTAARGPASAPNAAKGASDFLLSKQVATAEELLQAIERQAKMPMLRMGEALIALGHIDQTQLEQALTQQRADRGVPLGEILVRNGHIRRNDLQQALVRKMGYPVVDLGLFVPETDALAKIPYVMAARLQVLPLLLRAGKLIVALEDPTRVKALDELEFASGCKVVPALATQGVLGPVLDSSYQKMGAEVVAARMAQAEADGATVDANELLASLEMQGSEEAGGDDDRSIEQSDNSLVRLINQMILEAQSQGVSDIHVESQPGRDKVRIRFRRDGVLKPYMELPHTYRAALLARIKIMCDLDISEKRKPQDGKIAFGKFHTGSKLELRVATIPTNNGLEDAVMRLLASAKPMPIDNIGLAPRNLRLLKEIVERPYGMFLCVGPTGSGKTTTLHSALGYINVPDRKIWTAEDPVEITQAGLRQVQVNPKIDWTFAKALRAFLRADPDVIMVGEIRDNETATVAVESSLTGHLVLSTLHTNSAPETVTRLLDMGMDPFNFADALLGVLAQRLVRRICASCKTSRDATPAEIDELLGDYRNAFGNSEHKPSEDDVLASWRERFGTEGRIQHFHAPGCDKCGGSGLRGRAGVHELMPVSRDVRRLIQTGARVDELQKAAMAEGMLSLRQDGIEKVLQGVTTIAEVRANTN
jgi:type II secretory ATPase GspE/PulE/Tfp pilus assembly ATPase PilB-like protein